VSPGEVRVWRIRLEDVSEEALPPPTPGELARAARLESPQKRSEYLRAHRSLRALLERQTHTVLDFAVTERGKPYLPGMPELKFNLSRSHGAAMVAIALGVEVGVDVERLRIVPEYEAIAQRFFPPTEWKALAETPEPKRAREFFRRWTAIEARLKATGAGLYGAGMEIGGEWTLAEIDAGEGFAAAVAAMKPGMRVTVEDF
jgi:4'-phosphopantetheinyl transferase